MNKARVQSANVQLVFIPQSMPLPVVLGSLDSFKAQSTTSIIKRRPIGYVNEGATLNVGGYSLSFETSKIDWNLCHYYWLQEQKIRSGKLPPKFAVIETIKHYNGAMEQYAYKNVTIFGLELERGVDSISESFSGWATNRTLGPIDTTILSDPVGNLLREAVMRIRVEALEDIISTFERPF